MIGDWEWLSNPPSSRMTVAEWQTRLETTFNRNGVIGGLSLLPVFEAERNYRAYVEARFRGHLVLSESFQNFFFDTIRLAEDQWRQASHAGRREWYGVTIMECAALFRAVRAADVLLHSGYPLDGFSLFRDVRDRAIFLAGVGNRLTTLRELSGYDPNGEPSAGPLTEEMWKRMRKRAEAVEREVVKQTIGPGSGLDQATQEELNGWTALFHLEVHGSRLTRSSEFKEWWKTGKAAMPLIPKPRDDSLAMFVNRFGEVAWMILRVLVLLQLSPNAFGDEWAARWSVLDDSFRHNAEDLWRMEKPIEGAIVLMIDTKFRFSPNDSYVE